jgi:hypothetical protein
MLQQIIFVASVPRADAGSGRNGGGPLRRSGPRVHRKRSEHGGPHVHVQQQQVHAHRSHRRARAGMRSSSKVRAGEQELHVLFFDLPVITR